jgi:hypothetical protein
MKGFLSGVHKKVVTAYGSKKYSSGDRGTGESNPTGMSGTSDVEKPYAGKPKWVEQVNSSGTEVSGAGTRKTSDEFLKVDGKKKSMVGGIMVTETFSVDSNRHSWYLEERKRLGIP